MALEQKLSLKLAQRLVMTPSLQQAIKLLQMTRMELDTLLTQELVENPVLEESAEAADNPDAEEEVEAPREEASPLQPRRGRGGPRAGARHGPARHRLQESAREPAAADGRPRRARRRAGAAGGGGGLGPLPAPPVPGGRQEAGDRAGGPR